MAVLSTMYPGCPKRTKGFSELERIVPLSCDGSECQFEFTPVPVARSCSQRRKMSSLWNLLLVQRRNGQCSLPETTARVTSQRFCVTDGLSGLSMLAFGTQGSSHFAPPFKNLGAHYLASRALPRRSARSAMAQSLPYILLDIRSCPPFGFAVGF